MISRNFLHLRAGVKRFSATIVPFQRPTLPQYRVSHLCNGRFVRYGRAALLSQTL